jgi:glycosyltransferase involved in cell wall biosynthesis
MTSTAESPRVSVVIPAYNAAWCVARAIDSVLAQTCGDYELVVVDDGSTDETASVVARYGDRVRFVRQANGGLSSARNAGIKAARGEYVAFLDADDWWMPQKLERQLALLRERPDAVFCSTAARLVNPQSEPIGEWRCTRDAGSTLEAIFATNAHVPGSGSAVVARRQALVDAGGFDERLASLEDIDMWMRLASRGPFHCIDEPLAVILKRPGSMSRHLDVMRNAAIDVMNKNRHLLPPRKRGAFWRHAYAGMLTDYAKWEHREGRTREAVRHLAEVLLLAPFGRGRLALGLLAAIVLGRRF